MTDLEGVPQNCRQFWGRKATDRTPVGGRQDPPATTDRTPVGGRQDPPIRGYIKIDSATRAFDFDFKDKTVLDIGSSTGGFTEYALDHGAKKVIAVEKGSHQMKAPLRFDPRIELHEKTDIFDFVFYDGIIKNSQGTLRDMKTWPERLGSCCPKDTL